MADDVTFQTTTLATPPSGTVVSTDDVGGKQVQRMKLMDGTDAGSTMAKVSSEGNLQTITPDRTASGTLDALDEALTISTDGIVSVSAYFTASTLSGSIVFEGTVDGPAWALIGVTEYNSLASTSQIDDPLADDIIVAHVAGFSSFRIRVSGWNSGSLAISMRTSMGVQDGATSAPTVFVRGLAGLINGDSANGLDVDVTRLPALVAGTANIGDVDVLTLPLLPAGTNAIGKLAANDGVDIGNVDVASIAAGDNNIGNVDIVSVPAPLSTAGHGTAAAALRVELPTDGTGVIATVGTITNAVTVNAHAVTNAGVFATQVDGAALTALQLIDDTVYTDDTSTHATGTSKGNLMMAAATPTDTSVNANDIGALAMTTDRKLQVSVPDAVTVNSHAVTLTSTTITGTVAVTQSGTWDEVGINDSGNSITVDAPNGTPVFARITDATLNMGVVDETGASAVDAAAVGGGTPHDAVDSGNPLKVGAKAATAVPTAVAAADRVNIWADVYGRQIVQSGVPVGTEKWATAQYTSAQTGTALLTPTGGKKLIITSVQIQVGGTTAGTVQLWFGGAADTTYSRGTDRTIFDGEFAPSATLKPGFAQTKESGWVAAAADDVLRVTTSAAINPITFTVWGYEV